MSDTVKGAQRMKPETLRMKMRIVVVALRAIIVAVAVALVWSAYRSWRGASDGNGLDFVWGVFVCWILTIEIVLAVCIERKLTRRQWTSGKPQD